MFSNLQIFLFVIFTFAHLTITSPAGSSGPYVWQPKDDSRTVIQSRGLSNQVITTCKESGTFALTFDDGPYIYENELSDFLISRGVHGTFFVNGYNYDCIYDQNIVDQLKHTFGQGHLIGSHTWSHPDITTLSAEEFTKELELVETALRKILGIKPRYFRPPFGSINDENLRILQERGYKVITWSFDSGDSSGASSSSSDQAYDKLSKQYPTPQIALNHETHETTATEVSQHAVKVLQNVGYRLVSVSECLGFGGDASDFYQSVGEPEERDSSWTCAGTPKPSA